MHVHISRAPLTTLQIGKMQVFLHNPGNEAFIHCIAQRNPNEWAEIASTKKHGDAKRGENESRYTALNLQNRHTVEMRIFRGTIDAREVFKNIEFCDALVRWCAPSVAGVNECRRWQCFAYWVHARRKDYPHLVEYLRANEYLPRPDTKQRELFKKESALCV